MSLRFIEYLSSDGPPLSWAVDATDEEEAVIRAWLERNHNDDLPYVGPLNVIPFEEFKTTWMDPSDEED